MKKKLPFIKTNLNAEFTAKDMEHVSGVSETVPDQSWTIREILERWTISHAEYVLKNNPYNDIENDDLDFDVEDDFRQFKDITEAQEYADALNEKIEAERVKMAQNKTLKNSDLRKGGDTKTKRTNDITSVKKSDEGSEDEE